MNFESQYYVCGEIAEPGDALGVHFCLLNNVTTFQDHTYQGEQHLNIQ